MMYGDKLWCVGCGKYSIDVYTGYDLRNGGRPTYTGKGVAKYRFVPNCPFCFCNRMISVEGILEKGLILKLKHGRGTNNYIYRNLFKKFYSEMPDIVEYLLRQLKQKDLNSMNDKYNNYKMIEINKEKQVINEDLLNAEEAEFFMKYYLIPEIMRHGTLRDEARKNADLHKQAVLKTCWSLSALRHIDDISYTFEGIKKLCIKFRISYDRIGFSQSDKQWLKVV